MPPHRTCTPRSALRMEGTRARSTSLLPPCSATSRGAEGVMGWPAVGMGRVAGCGCGSRSRAGVGSRLNASPTSERGAGANHPGFSQQALPSGTSCAAPAVQRQLTGVPVPPAGRGAGQPLAVDLQRRGDAGQGSIDCCAAEAACRDVAAKRNGAARCRSASKTAGRQAGRLAGGQAGRATTQQVVLQDGRQHRVLCPQGCMNGGSSLPGQPGWAVPSC